MRRGALIWVSRSRNKNRSLKWTWELTKKGNTLVGTNSVTANALIGEALRRGYIHGFRTARQVTGERFCGPRTRIDFEVDLRTGVKHYIEVKNCHLRYPDGNAYFPDSKTQRSVRHLRHLRRLIREGHRASLFIAVQRADVKSLRPSEFHDPEFTRALRRAAAVGVSVRAFSFRPTARGFHFSKEIPVDLSSYETNQIRIWSERQRQFSGWNHWNSEKDIC